MFRRAVDRVTVVLEWVSIACFIVTVLLVVVSVCLRPLHIAAPWSDEGACLLFIWTSFLSAAVALKRNLHIRIDVLLLKLPPRMKRRLPLFSGPPLPAFLHRPALRHLPDDGSFPLHDLIGFGNPDDLLLSPFVRWVFHDGRLFKHVHF